VFTPEHTVPLPAIVPPIDAGLITNTAEAPAPLLAVKVGFIDPMAIL
jgi:hypothetical protein